MDPQILTISSTHLRVEVLNVGASLVGLWCPDASGRLDNVVLRHAELHACRMCEFYDTSKAKHCREPVAEEVKDKAVANFCDYFKPTARAFDPTEQQAENAARSTLDSLFKK